MIKDEASKSNSGRGKLKKGFPIIELKKQSRERIAEHIFRICKRLVCDCCALADIYEADRDDVIRHVWYMLGNSLENGTFVRFNVEDARRDLSGVVKADVVK